MLYDPVGGWGFEWDTQCLLLSKTVGVLNQGAQGESEVGSKGRVWDGSGEVQTTSIRPWLVKRVSALFGSCCVRIPEGRPVTWTM